MLIHLQQQYNTFEVIFYKEAKYFFYIFILMEPGHVDLKGSTKFRFRIYPCKTP